MSYKSNGDLPLEVRNHMPPEAQTIFREAFNNALKEYGDRTRAFKVAWTAVEREYVKSNKGHWNKKDHHE